MSADIAVIIPAHAPDPGRLRRTLAGLSRQSLPPHRREIVLIDNGSPTPVTPGADAPAGLRVVREPRLGLTFARLRGFMETRAKLIVMVDDDNVLAPDYLARSIELFAAHPELGAAGGRSLPVFAREPAEWQREFFNLLAVRDLGEELLLSPRQSGDGDRDGEYPACAPIGAGMVIRRVALDPWLSAYSAGDIPDRRGGELSSGGDNDIVLSLLSRGWQVAYDPLLSLRHLIPAARLDPAYLARLNRGIQKSWVQVLARHNANPWPPIPRWTLPLRCAKAYLTQRAWASPAARIRWQGICGRFEGQASLRRSGFVHP